MVGYQSCNTDLKPTESTNKDYFQNICNNQKQLQRGSSGICKETSAG